MIVYFADREFRILGQASTHLPQGLTVIEDTKTEDIESGIATFECRVSFDNSTRALAKSCADVGNYILRKNGDECEFYTIIDTEEDTKNFDVWMYAEDAGLDLLNEIVGAYTADKAYSAAYYIEKFAYDSGFTIGINEIPNLTRTLSWDGETTAAERIASVATQFDNCEISYSFDVDGLVVTGKYINIHKKRGADNGVQLRLNREVDRIITKKTIANLCTSLLVTGGTPENAKSPITLNGYEYDDGDIYINGKYLNSRSAVQKWSRYLYAREPAQISGHVGNIVRRYSYDTTSQKTLCSRAVAELKSRIDAELNFEVDFCNLPQGVKIGDRVNIIDEAGELYLSTRILKLETSISNDSCTATLGEFLIKSGGISQKVEDLAQQFAEQAQKNEQQYESIKDQVQTSDNKADEALAGLDQAKADAEAAQTAANESKAQADAAAAAAAQAKADAANASAQVTIAQTAAKEATTKAETAQSTAETAKTQADTAKATADAAKLDAQTARDEIAGLGTELETVSQTMTAEYARKTELTEAESKLQTQISQNAAEIKSTASQVTKIDETANNANTQAQQAVNTANTAQTQASQAIADAADAQAAADSAASSATAAQAQADTAKSAATAAQTAAQEAKTKADTAQSELDAAKQNLSDVSAKADATETEVAAAQAAVAEAEKAAAQARTDAQAAQAAADQAAADAKTAQDTADTAHTAATNAQAAADEAKKAADAAQAAANALAVRVTTAETNITQNSEQIALRATKEEVATAIDGLTETVHTQKTEVIAESESIMMSALENYVHTDDYAEYQASVSAQLEIMADEIEARFTQTETQIEEVDGELQERTNEIYKHINLSENGVIINSGSNRNELQLDNDAGIIFSKNGDAFGDWNGSELNTGSIIIRPAERLQIGNFAFISRADGSMALLDVSGMYAILAILRQPSNVTVTQAETATFTVTARGSGALSYQWRYKDTEADDWTNYADVANEISGATTNTLTLTGFAGAVSDRLIQCVVTDANAGETAESDTVTLNVTL